MKWRNARGSRNIEDRRGRSTAKSGGMGILGIVAVLAIGYFTSIDVSSFISNSGTTRVQQGSIEISDQDKERGGFVSAALGYTEQLWLEVFPDQVGKNTAQRH